MIIPTLVATGDYPTRTRALRDIAFAFKELGAMPKAGRMSPGTWALLCMDHFGAICPCDNCRGAMREVVLAGVTIRPDRTVPDGEHHLDAADNMMFVKVVGYQYEALCAS